MTGLPGSAPGFQTYVDAPPALRLVDCPAQIGFVDATEVTVGVGLTVTVITKVFVHVPVVPVTVYA